MRTLGWMGCLLMLGACSDQQIIGDDGFYAFALTADTPAAFEGDEGEAFFVVEERIALPIAPPTDAELAELGATAPPPFPRMPWVVRGDYQIEIDYVLINLDDARRDVTVTLNGFNEFHEYMPGFQAVDEELVADFAGWERAIRLEPFERRLGTIREEEIDEVTVDLATVVNGVSNPNLVMHPDTPQTDPRTAPFVPEVVPALTGVRVGLRAAAAVNVLIELTVRVRDENHKIVKASRAWELPAPMVVTPADLVPEEEMP